MRRVLLTLSLLLLAGCGGDGTRTVTETVTRTETVTAPDDVVEPAEQRSVQVWFARGESLAMAVRDASGEQVATQAMQALVTGPTAAERRTGLTSSIPAGTQLHGVTVEEGLATVDLSSEFASGGGSASMSMRVAQVVFTLTQFPTVERVAFELDGEPVEAIGGEGVVVDPPVTRSDFEDQSPQIVVDAPGPGATVASPIVLEGTANTFEATLEAELRIDTRVVDTARILATSGSGTRGTWTASLETDEAGPATITVFSRSAEDGRRINVVTIPVTIDG